MKTRLSIILFFIFIINISGQQINYTLNDYIPRIGKPHHEEIYIKGFSQKIYKESFFNGLIVFYRRLKSNRNLFVVIDNDTLMFNNNDEIINGYKTEYLVDYNYLIFSKYRGRNLVWSKGYYIGKDINVEGLPDPFVLKSGTLLSDSRHQLSQKGIENLSWIQFYDKVNIKRITLFDQKTQTESNIELYPGNKVAIIQTYVSYTEHTDSIFSKRGELIDVYKYDSENKLVQGNSNAANMIIYSLMDSEFAWDFFYPFNHCKESLLNAENE